MRPISPSARYPRHGSLVTVWGRDDLVPLESSAHADTEVWFALPDRVDHAEYWEALNAVVTEPGVAELRAVPALAYGLALGDRITTVGSAEGPLVATGVEARGGFVTFRLMLAEEAAFGWRDVAERFARLGGLIDVYSERLIAIGCRQEIAATIQSELDDVVAHHSGEWERG